MKTKMTKRETEVFNAIQDAMNMPLPANFSQLKQHLRTYPLLTRYVKVAGIFGIMICDMEEKLGKDSELCGLMSNLLEETRHNLKLYIDGGSLEGLEPIYQEAEDYLIQFFHKDAA